MNFKKTAIALAVAGIATAPIAAQAEVADIYASVRVGIWNVEQGFEDVTETTTDSTSELDVRSFSSRFGVKAETDLGNGMTGFGRYEWDVDFNNDNAEDDISVRQRFVGVKGDFGKILLGQTYHTYYSFVVGPTDIPWWHAGYAMLEYRGRTDNAITYASGGDNFNFGVSAYFSVDATGAVPAVAAVPAVPGDAGTAAQAAAPAGGEESIDQLEVGVSFAIGDFATLGVGVITAESGSIGNGVVDSSGDPEDVLGITLHGISLGPATLGFVFESQDDDTGLSIELDVGNAYFRLESETLDGLAIDADGLRGGVDQDRLGITLGYTQNLGPDTLIYYEIHSLDNDTGNDDDDRTAVMAVLKYNLI
jgi:predicted porin